MKLYHELAEYYFSIEKKSREIREDIALIVSLMRGREKPVILDIGCGTGEHLAQLHQHGFRCFGLDNSEEMIRIARERFPGTASLMRTDMTEFDFFEEFDIVICLFGTFNYLLEDSQVEKVLWNTWRALKPGCIALFEIWNSIPVRRIREKSLSPVSVTEYNMTTIERQRGFHLQEGEKKTIVDVDYTYLIRRGSGTETIKDRHIMRAFRKDEIESFIGNNGFKIRDIYSTTKRDLYKDSSNKMIILFEKA